MTGAASGRPAVVFVLGMHRSGTSALTRALTLGGLRMPADVLAANQDNPLGYWEPKSVVAFNQRLLQHVDRHWADPKPLPLGWEGRTPPGLGAGDAAALLRDELTRARGADPTAAAVIKDPRLCRTFALWRQAAALCGVDAACIFVCRDPRDVATSLEKRERMDRDHAMDLSLGYMLEAEAGTRGMPRTAVAYDDLLGRWREELRRATEEIGLSDMTDFDRKARTIDTFLDKKHRHHFSARSGAADPAQPDAAAVEVFHLLAHPLTADNQAELDRIRLRRAQDWARRSPGEKGSEVPGRLPGWHAERSRELDAAGQREEAIAAARQAVALAPDIMRFHFILGDLLIKADRLEEGVAALRDAVAIDGSQIRVHRLLSSALERLGDTEAAISATTAAIDLGGQAADDHHRLGRLLIRSRRFEDALGPLNRAIGIDGSKANYHRSLSVALSGLDRTEEAIRAAAQATDLAPARADLACHLGRLLQEAGRPGDAIAPLMRAVELNDAPLHHHTALARARNRAGKVTEAIETLLRVSDRPEFHAGLCDHLADLLASRDRLGEACALYAKAVAKRCRTFGLRPLTPERPADADSDTSQEAPRRELGLMLARLGARYWAEDIAGLLASPAERPAQGPEWPAGQALPQRRFDTLPSAEDRPPTKTLSVMVPVYEVRQETWLREALDGVLAQIGQADWAEVVVLDDASVSPVARQVAESYGAPVRYLRNDANLGLVANHNRCLAEASGEFVHILHQDDRVEPGFYDALLPAMKADRRLVAGFCQTGYISDRSSTVRGGMPLQPRGLLEHWHIKLATYRIQFASIIVRRDTCLALGGFSPSFEFAFDWDMWNRIAASGPVWYEPELLALYRAHGGSATASFGRVHRVVETMRVVAYMLGDIPPDRHPGTAQLAMQKVFLKYWRQVIQTPRAEWTGDLEDLRHFLLDGWATLQERSRIADLLDRASPSSGG